jgi:hypothetical protein
MRTQAMEFFYVKLSKRCAPWKIANGAENLVLQALQFH